MAQDHLFAEILNSFAQLEKWIPGCGSWPIDLMFGKLPQADPANIYRLADAWGAAAKRMNSYYDEVSNLADPILAHWQGDGAPMAFQQAWSQHLQNIGGTLQAMDQMQQMAQGYGLQLETEEFFIAFTMIQLLVEAIVAIIGAIFTAGISVGGLAGAYAAARIAVKEAFEKCLQAILHLSEVLASGELRRMLAETTAKDLLEVGGRSLVDHGGQLVHWTKNAIVDEVRGLSPRTFLSRAAADKAADQFQKDILKSVLRKELRNQLEQVSSKAEARAAVRVLDQAGEDLSRRIAAELQQRLLTKFGGHAAEDLADSGLANLGDHAALEVAGRMGGDGVAARTEAMVNQFVADQVAKTTMLGTAGSYVGKLALRGAAQMGGIDALAQGVELVTGERSSIDVAEVGISLGQGGLMGGLMFGHGLLGSMATGGIAGTATAAAMDGGQALYGAVTGQHEDIHWGADLRTGASDGVRMGLVFGAPGALSGLASRFAPHGDPIFAGHEVFGLDDPRLGSNTFTMNRDTGEIGFASEHGGAGYHLSDGSYVRLDSDGNLIASHRAGDVIDVIDARDDASGVPGGRVALAERPTINAREPAPSPRPGSDGTGRPPGSDIPNRPESAGTVRPAHTGRPEIGDAKPVEVPADQVPVRAPHPIAAPPVEHSHAESVRAGLLDRRAPEALRAQQQEHLGRTDADQPPPSLVHITKTMHELSLAGREATLSPEITASAVPHSDFQGFGRPFAEPGAVKTAGDDALRHALDRLGDEHHLRGTHLEVTSVRVEELSGLAVARSVPIDELGHPLPPHTVPPADGGYRIEISDHAADVNIGRAVNHEVAEIAAIERRTAAGLQPRVPDALHDGELEPDAELSPHDMGRLAELNYLSEQAVDTSGTDPVGVRHAQDELDALRRHLGIAGDGDAARRSLIDDHLNPSARHLLDEAPAGHHPVSDLHHEVGHETGRDITAAAERDAAKDWGIPPFPITLPADHPLLRATDTINTPERIALRAKWVSDVIGDAQAPTEGRPVMYLMGGGGASGKGFVLERLWENGTIPKRNVVHLDPDWIKENKIPECAQIVATGDSRAAAVAHEESSDLAKAILTEALTLKANLIYDVTLGGPRKAFDMIQRVHAAGYEIRLYGVTADADEAVIRNAARAADSGRYVPIEMQLSAHRGFSQGFPGYADLVDSAQLFDTNGRSPVPIAVKLPGDVLRVVNEDSYRNFLHKADLDPHAGRPADLFPPPVARIEPPQTPPERDAYVQRAMDNLARTSRTASGTVDTSASPDKAAQMTADLSGDRAAELAQDNYRGLLGDLYDNRNIHFDHPEQLTHFTEQLVRRVNAGITRDGVLYREHDSAKYPSYTAVKDLPQASKRFFDELFDRLNDPAADPVETAAFIEYRMDMTDHLWADGVGKSSKALAAWVLMRSGYHLPAYPALRSDQFAHAPRLPSAAGAGVDDVQYRDWLDYYRSLFGG